MHKLLNISAIEHRKLYYSYVLELENGYYYVGITARSNPLTRIDEHFAGVGAKWTRLHKPVRLLRLTFLGQITEDVAKEHEQGTAQNLMDAYGYNNVRGGAYTYSGNYIKFNNRYLQTNVLTSHWV